MNVEPSPSRLDHIVGILAKVVVLLWVSGFGLLLVNSFAFDQRGLYLVAVGAIRGGFLLALIILFVILSAVIRRRVNKD